MQSQATQMPAAAEIKVGIVFDMTGPLAASGSKAAYLGTRIAIDMINERGGIEGRKIAPVYVDAQSQTDVALREVESLMTGAKVDALMGFFSSAQCLPVSAKAEAAKTFLWLSICVATDVLRDKNLQYVFRPQVHSDHYGEASCAFVAETAKAKFGRDPKDMKIAVLYGEGPYGAGIAALNERSCKALGLQVVLKEGYDANANDFTALVTKIQRARPDVVLHTGYNRDIGQFLRQTKQAGAKWGALIGHGAGYAQIDRLHATFKDDVDYLLNVDPVATQHLDPKTLKPGIADLGAEMVKRYRAETGITEVPSQASGGFNHAWIFFDDVVRRAIKNHGGTDAEALRKAALETDIPVGGTIQGYGVKFFGPGTPLAGQNERAEPAIMQYLKGETKVVAPTAIKTAEPVLPLPRGHAYAP